jgi:hypothetical protein
MNTVTDIINRYRAEGFSDNTILQRVIEGGVDESDLAIMSVDINVVASILRR